MYLFVDCDGVLADFELHFLNTFGFAHDSVSDAEMWNLINDNKTFFADIPPFPRAKEFFHYVSGMFDRTFFLTACPAHDYQRVALLKKAWVKEHICSETFLIPMTGGKNKALFLHEPCDVLIDDFEKNIIPWQANGGYGILHTDMQKTVREIEEAVGGYE